MEAWTATQSLLTLARQAVQDAASARFKVNFGTSPCDSCDGLKAGPGVVATCFQVKQCYYTNLKTTDESPKHERILSRLVGS